MIIKCESCPADAVVICFTCKGCFCERCRENHSKIFYGLVSYSRLNKEDENIKNKEE